MKKTNGGSFVSLGMAAALPFGVSADETEEKEPVHLPGGGCGKPGILL